MNYVMCFLFFPREKTILHLKAGLLTYIIYTSSHRILTVTKWCKVFFRTESTVAGTVLDFDQIPFSSYLKEPSPQR